MHNTAWSASHLTRGRPGPNQGAAPEPDAGALFVRLRMATVNEGKLSLGKQLAIGDWFKRANLDLLIASEGALRERSARFPDGQTYMSPTCQRWGGVGILCKTEIATGRRCRYSTGEKEWSVTAWALDPKTIIVGGYITPTAATSHDSVQSFLNSLSGHIERYDNVLLAGDFNMPSGHRSRDRLNIWASEHGLMQHSTGPTHFAEPNSPGTDLDLVFSRGIGVTGIEKERPLTGHSRQTFEILVPPLKINPREARIQWEHLPENIGRYNNEVSRLVREGMELEEAMTHAGRTVLGTTYSRAHNRIPRKARRQIRTERRKLRTLPKGSAEYQESLTRINSILAKWRNRGWRSKLNQLSGSNVEREAWKLAKKLASIPSPLNAGIPEHELVARYHDIYSTNRTLRPEWQTPNHRTERKGPLDRPFTATELKRTLDELPRRKAAGPDMLPYEAYKACSMNPDMLRELLARYNRYLDSGYSPAWAESRMIAIPKPKGNDVRPLNLLCAERKILEKLVMARIRKLDLGLHRAQSGFRPGMSSLRSLLSVHLHVLGATHVALSLC